MISKLVLDHEQTTVCFGYFSANQTFKGFQVPKKFLLHLDSRFCHISETVSEYPDLDLLFKLIFRAAKLLKCVLD